MSYYTQGNLALKEAPGRKRETSQPKQQARQRVSSPAPQRKKMFIPLGEKMLYLFSILACVAIAGLILWQYAEIYQVNTRIQKVEREITLLEKENNVLQLEGQRLQEPKRLQELGKSLGFIPATEESVVSVSPDKTYVTSQGEKVATLE